MDHRSYCLVFLALVSTAAWGQPASPWTMVETRAGQAPKTVTYQRASTGGNETLVCLKERRTLTTVVDASGSTVGWKKTDAAGTTVEVTREGKELVSRSAKGEEQFPAGEIRWIQDLNQLSTLVLGGESKIRFAAFADFLDSRLKASDMTVFQATKVKKETQTWGTGTGLTWKVHVTFDDLRAAFWGADYWFRVSDGRLVRYEEVRGGPGTPVTVGVLASEGP